MSARNAARSFPPLVFCTSTFKRDTTLSSSSWRSESRWYESRSHATCSLHHQVQKMVPSDFDTTKIVSVPRRGMPASFQRPRFAFSTPCHRPHVPAVVQVRSRCVWVFGCVLFPMLATETLVYMCRRIAVAIPRRERTSLVCSNRPQVRRAWLDRQSAAAGGCDDQRGHGGLVGCLALFLTVLFVVISLRCLDTDAQQQQLREA